METLVRTSNEFKMNSDRNLMDKNKQKINGISHEQAKDENSSSFCSSFNRILTVCSANNQVNLCLNSK